MQKINLRYKFIFIRNKTKEIKWKNYKKKKKILIVVDFTVMRRTRNRNKHIEIIDLTEDDDVNEELLLDNQYQSSTFEYKHLIENKVSS